MAVILAFVGRAVHRARFFKGQSGRERRGGNPALGRFASTEVASLALYHRTGDCHATPIFVAQGAEDFRTCSRAAGGVAADALEKGCGPGGNLETPPHAKLFLIFIRLKQKLCYDAQVEAVVVARLRGKKDRIWRGG
jgi:hypothetical protein